MTRKTGKTTKPNSIPLGVPQAVLYARVSSKEQEKEGFSIPAQQKLLVEYAEAQGIAIAAEFVDIETAKASGRTGFSEMLAFLRTNARTCRTLLVEKTDRLYRNLKDWVTLDELDLEIHFVKEGVVLSADSRSSEKFMHGIKVLMAKNYIDNLSEETRKGMNEKAEQGYYPSYAPLGYKNTLGPDGKRVIEPDPEYAPLIRQLFEWHATGQYTLAQTGKMARDSGLCFRKSGAPLPSTSVHKILRNRTYTGDFMWKGRVFKGKHEALVDQDLWDRVQEVMDRRTHKRPGFRRHDFAFAGLVSCGHCGCLLTGQIQKERLIYYHCSGFKGRCGEPYLREEKLSEHLGGVLEALQFDDQVAAWVLQALRESHGDKKQFQNEAIAKLEAQRAQLQDRLDAMYVDKLDGRISLEYYERISGQWRGEQDALLRAIQSHQGADHDYMEEGIQLLELAQRAHGLFLQQEPREQRRLLNFVLEDCSWKEGTLTPVYRPPFDLLAATVAEDRALQSRTAQANSTFERPQTRINRTPGGPSGGRKEIWLRERDLNPQPSG